MILSRTSVVADICAWACACFLGLTILPVYMIALSPGDFSGIDFSWFWRIAIILFLGSFGIGMLIYGLLKMLRLSILASILCWGVLFWVALAGFAIPIIKSVDMVAPSNTPIAPIGFTVVLVLAILLTAIALTSFRRFALIYIAIQLSVTFATVAPTIVSVITKERPLNTEQFLTLSPDLNILVISLDDISRVLTLDNLNAYPTLRHRFKDFTFFEHLTGNAPGTALSIAHELFGAVDFKAIGADSKELVAGLDLEMLAMNDPQVDAATYGSYNYLNSIPSRRVEIDGLSNNVSQRSHIARISDLYHYVAVRLATRYLPAAMIKLENRGLDLTALLNKILELDCRDCSALERRLENHAGPIWDREAVSSFADFDSLVERTRVGESSFVLRYMHFLFTHFPIDFDADCEYRSDSYKWFEANQNQQAAYAETTCALRKLATLIDRLKKLGIYDNSLIIFKSDHGKIKSYFDTHPHNAGFNGNLTWGLDRYRPMLMIKDIDTRSDILTVSDRAVAISDLASTICPRLPASASCEAYTGVDMLAPSATQEPPFSVYLPRDASSTHRLDTLEAVILQRGDDLADLVDK